LARRREAIAVTPWAWAFIGLALLLSELMSMSFYLVYLALAAAVTAVVAAGLTDLVAQSVVFGVCAVLAVGVLRPRTVNWLLRTRGAPTQPFPDLTARRAVVHEAVDDQSGMVDLGGGEFWSARAYPPGQQFEPGTRVQVAYRQGVVLYVQRIPD
jgi:membrane protein implicated in regulation of membrane protease activity